MRSFKASEPVVLAYNRLLSPDLGASFNTVSQQQCHDHGASLQPNSAHYNSKCVFSAEFVSLRLTTTYLCLLGFLNGHGLHLNTPFAEQAPAVVAISSWDFQDASDKRIALWGSKPGCHLKGLAGCPLQLAPGHFSASGEPLFRLLPCSTHVHAHSRRCKGC